MKTVNTAARAEDHTCSVPIQSASCRNPSRGENTFKHTLFSLHSNMNWAPTFSASVVWVYFRRAFCTALCQTQTNAMSSDPSGTLFCKHHISTVSALFSVPSFNKSSISFDWLNNSTSNCFRNNLKKPPHTIKPL